MNEKLENCHGNILVISLIITVSPEHTLCSLIGCTNSEVIFFLLIWKEKDRQFSYKLYKEQIQSDYHSHRRIIYV